jgi:phage repressor protein C with HTH and peptisase S24 domain
MNSPNQLMIARLKREMQRVGVNARELSERANVGRSFVYDILSGKSVNPTTQKISAVADALGVSVPYLMAGTSNDNEILKTTGENFSLIPITALEFKEDGSYIVSTKPQSEAFFFKKDWIEKHLNTRPENLRVVFIQGDIMEPTLYNNDMVLMDISKTVPNPPGIFVIFEGAGLIVKRLEYIRKHNTPQVIIKPDNRRYTSYECDLLEVDIVGKVVWFSRDM